MKDLDESKVYDLSDLDDSQKKELITYLKNKYQNWRNATVFLKKS